MTIEEKARAYDEALKRAKAAIDVAADKDLVGGVVRTVFPEFRESEDEKKVKGFIDTLRKVSCFAGNEYLGVEIADCIGWFIDWLEKQKEQKSIDIDYISGIREELLGIENNARNIDGLTESQWVAIRAAHRLLGEYIKKEQKPAELDANDKAFIKFCARFLDESGYPTSAERLLSMFPIKPAEWSEEDNMQLNAAIQIVNNSGHSTTANWLKSLRPQPKQELSEEDDEVRKELITHLEQEACSATTIKNSKKWRKMIAYLEKQKG